ncbi:hypothetical protein [Akkermansia sp.]|uniref:hypothetical protein n=1 Tax=Akkermansia sp. TaxID=1872421 RepID=UPI0025C700D3|nr:hypothetical protein [Akkermansia sp.]
MQRAKDWGYEVQAAIVRHKGITARARMVYPTKRHARWAQHFICTEKNASRLRCFDELRALIDGKGGQQ